MGEISSLSLQKALEEYKTDPREDWFGYLGSLPSDSRSENYLRLVLSDILEAVHDGELISQDFGAFSQCKPSSLEELEERGKTLNVVFESPFFHSSLMSLSQIDGFIREMGEYEKRAKRLKRRMDYILGGYSEEVFSLSERFLLSFINSPRKKDIATYYERFMKKTGKLDKEKAVLLSQRLLWIKKEAKELKEMEKEFTFTSSLFSGVDTLWPEYAAALKEYRSALMDLKGFVSDDFTLVYASLRRGLSRLDDYTTRYGDSLEKAKSLFQPPFLSLSFPLLKKKVAKALSSFSLLPLWVKYRDVFTQEEEEIDKYFSPEEKEIPIEIKKEEKEEEKEEERGIVFPPYPIYDIQKRAGELGVETPSSYNFPLLLSDFLDNMAPITERDALRYFFHLYGEEGRERALDLNGVEYLERNGFWYKKGGVIKFRESTFRRDFSHISPEELLDGMLSILSVNKVMTKGDLYNALGVKCGMKSVLSVRYKELDRVLYSSDRVSVDGENIRILEDVE